MATRIAKTSRVAANGFGAANILFPAPSIRRKSDAMIGATKIDICQEKLLIKISQPALTGALKLLLADKDLTKVKRMSDSIIYIAAYLIRS
jgi:hypothetical protein